MSDDGAIGLAPPAVSSSVTLEDLTALSPMVFQIGLSIGRNRSFAEDVVQETMLKAWRNLDGFRGDAPVASAAAQVTASSLIMLPIVALADQPWTLPLPSAQVIGAIALLGIVSTGFAYILFFSILKSAGATNVMLVTLLVPVTAILLGAFVLGERLGASDFAGMALIALGLAAIDGRIWKRFTRFRSR